MEIWFHLIFFRYLAKFNRESYLLITTLWVHEPNLIILRNINPFLLIIILASQDDTLLRIIGLHVIFMYSCSLMIITFMVCFIASVLNVNAIRKVSFFTAVLI